MKKVISVKEITIVLIAMLIIMFSTHVNATGTGGLVFEDDNYSANAISGSEYEDWQSMLEDKNTTGGNNTANNVANNATNNTKVYNTNNTTDLPQTGIEDYNIGILLIICIASAIYAYRKVNDYKNI